MGAHDGAASEEEEFAGVEAGLVVYVEICGDRPSPIIQLKV